MRGLAEAGKAHIALPLPSSAPMAYPVFVATTDRNTSAGIQSAHEEGGGQRWAADVHRALKNAGVRHMSFVPDAGHASLIELFKADREVITNVLTTEEEGVAIAAGAWLGGQRSVVLMQSSGVGNCINMLSLAVIGRFPLLMLVTMRGEWAEFNPWQMPMGLAAQAALEAVGVRTMRAETPADLIEITGAAARLAYDADQQIAVLISQRMLGDKKW
jgi:sulfopyruvate decarboxylase alpha subunit